jgi:hypothetical protein
VAGQVLLKERGERHKRKKDGIKIRKVKEAILSPFYDGKYHPPPSVVLRLHSLL